MRLIPRNDPEANALVYKEMEKPLKKVLQSYSQRNTKGMMERITSILTSAGYDGSNGSKVLVKKADPSTIRTLEELAQRLPDGPRERMMARLYGQIGSGSLSVRKAVDNVIRYGATAYVKEMHQEAQEVLRETALEGMYRGEFMVQKSVGVGWQMETPNLKQVDAFLKDKWSLRDATAYLQPMSQVMKDQVTESIFLGESPQKMAKRMEKVDEISKVRANRNARTITTAVANEAQMDSYKKDGIKKFRWVATFDERTCPECGELDGQEFEIGKKSYPPAHPNCRCTTSAVLDKKAQERVNAIVEAHKGDKGAKYVPPDMTYKDWAAKNITPSKPQNPKPKTPTKKQERVEEIKARGVSVPPHETYGKLSWEEVDKMSMEEQRAAMIDMRNKVVSHPPTAELTDQYPESYDSDYVGNRGRMEAEARDWEEGLDESEKTAIMRYTGSSYDAINASCYLPEENLWHSFDNLRGLTEDDRREMLTRGVANMEHMDRAISKFEVKEPMTVFRGMGNPFGMPPSEAVGKVWESKGYTSTSIVENISEGFGGYSDDKVKLHIKIPKGKGMGAYVSNLSGYETEREFLIKRGSKFKIEKVDGEDVYMSLIE